MWRYAGTCRLMKYNLFFFKSSCCISVLLRTKVKKKVLVSEGGRGGLVEHVAKSEWAHPKPCWVCSCSTPRSSHPQISQSRPPCPAMGDAVGHGKIHTLREALLFTPWAFFKGRDWINYPWAQTNNLPLWQAMAEVRPLQINALDFKDKC